MAPNPGLLTRHNTGCHDNHIYQYDLRDGQLVQDYDRHLGPVNSVTLIEGASGRWLGAGPSHTLNNRWPPLRQHV